MVGANIQGDYFLPLRYDESKITLLARDPNWLYAYWEISGSKKDEFIREFGYELWEKSVPVLKVINVSKNTSFFIRINDFSNNWYINVPDANMLYVVEMGRKVADRFFINLASSNYVSTPSNSVSTNTATYFINYNSLKNGKLDMETKTIYESYNFKSHSKFMVGISSPELMGIGLEEASFGISSAELFGINISEHFGISSEAFLK
ncbi:MAG: DUF4912 domain-containing protein [Clostridia bacterium]|nr:DUF4912 domain-containing protein [Clostridia bacterium]